MSRIIYYAGPLFTDAERAWNAANAQRLKNALPGIDLRLPQDFCAHLASNQKPDYAAIFLACRTHLEAAQVVVAVVDGADADSGTAWEMGYACGRGIPVIALRTDWRPAEDGAANCMLSRSAQRVCTNLEEVIVALGEILK